MPVPVSNIRFHEFDDEGNPLVGGMLYFYVPGTSTPKDVWSDPAGSMVLAQPIVLDSQGSAIVFADGVYDVELRNPDGTLRWRILSVPLQSGGGGGGGGGTSILYGQASFLNNAYSLSTGGDPTSYTDGLQVLFRAPAQNTGPATLNINGIGAVAIKKVQGSALVDLAAGDIANGAVVFVVYDQTDAVWKALGGLTRQDVVDQVGASMSDAAPGYLSDKVTVAEPLTTTLLNPGGNEQLKLGVDPSKVDAKTVEGKSLAVSAIANTIPLRDADGRITGDITGSAGQLRDQTGTARSLSTGDLRDTIALRDLNGYIRAVRFLGPATTLMADDLTTEHYARKTPMANRIPIRDANAMVPGDITGSAASVREVGTGTARTVQQAASAYTIPLRDGSAELPNDTVGAARNLKKTDGSLVVADDVLTTADKGVGNGVAPLELNATISVLYLPRVLKNLGTYEYLFGRVWRDPSSGNIIVTIKEYSGLQARNLCTDLVDNYPPPERSKSYSPTVFQSYEFARDGTNTRALYAGRYQFAFVSGSIDTSVESGVMVLVIPRHVSSSPYGIYPVGAGGFYYRSFSQAYLVLSLSWFEYDPIGFQPELDFYVLIPPV